LRRKKKNAIGYRHEENSLNHGSGRGMEIRGEGEEVKRELKNEGMTLKPR